MVSEERANLDRHLRAALAYLYDPAVLSKNPLVRLLHLDAQPKPGAALRVTLLEAIEALRPGQDIPQAAKSERVWRVYHVLRRRYTEQATQLQVATELSLSKRQVQREEKIARQVLADYLRATYPLTACPPTPHPAAEGDTSSPTPAQELAWLQESVPAELTDVGAVIRGALETLRPLQEAAGVTVEYTAPDALPETFLRAPLLRQALLDILTTLVSSAPGGKVCLEAQVADGELALSARAESRRGIEPRGVAKDTRHDGAESELVVADARDDGAATSLTMARQLVHLCGGELRIVPPVRSVPSVPSIPPVPGFEVSVILPNTAQVTVLVIDDNADALRLFEHYLAGSRYRFVGAQDAQRGLALAEELAPPIIVLDVMMPAQDGWSLLRQLREHPRTQGSAIVICTILAQEQLAWALGAAAFMRKPVRRGPLLALLDRLLDLPQREC